MVTINGEEIAIQGVSISTFLLQAGYKTEHVAVEKNLIIVPKNDYDKTIIQDGDRIEIVSFVGGG